MTDFENEGHARSPNHQQGHNQQGFENTVNAPAQENEADGQPKMDDGWPLEADRLAIHSTLVECLRLMAG